VSKQEFPAGRHVRAQHEDPPLDPSRFGTIEIPPELRARLLSVELPRVPREQLEDTDPDLRLKLRHVELRGKHAIPWMIAGAVVLIALVAAALWEARQ
jgi:hypothetical protein